MDARTREQNLPQFVWPTVGHPGRVPLDVLIPNPYQPRKEFDEDELKSLASTMKEENGGEQREILTVRELTEEDQKSYPLPVRYAIISGERRWRAAHLAQLADIEIRVKKYASRAKEKLDMYMLNEGRVGLSDIENADYLAGLMEDFNLSSQEELGRLVGKDQNTISNLLALTKLSAKARALMLPGLPEYARLKRNVGVFLSRLSHQVQDDFADRMPKGREATAVQQVRWMQDELKKTGEQLPTRLSKPSTIRRVLGYFAEQTERRSTQFLELENFDDLFQNAPMGQRLDLLGKIKDAQVEFSDLVIRIEKLSKEADERVPARLPKPTPAPEPAVKPTEDRLALVKAAQQRLQEKPPPAATKSKPMARPIASTQAVPAQPRAVPKVSPVISKVSHGQMHFREKTITYYSDSAGRKVTTKVTRDQYIDLWDGEQLGFQVDKQDRPEWMPTRQAALEDWNKFCD